MIYLDHNATTPVLPEVFAAMEPYLREEWGNPSSSYRFGSKLKAAIETAREQVAGLIGASPPEIVFTSGGTESDNTALHAILRADLTKRHLITSAVEHSAVLSFCRGLEPMGFRITCLPVDRDGLLSLADLEAAITPDTAGASLMWANNETGVLCAPKGIGALYIRRKAPFTPFIQGGHQERGRRGGTECVPLIAGLGTAAALARKKLATYDRTVRPLRDALETGLLAAIPGTVRHGHPGQRLANTANIHFPGIGSKALLLLLDQAGLCASSGSACLADSPDPFPRPRRHAARRRRAPVHPLLSRHG